MNTLKTGRRRVPWMLVCGALLVASSASAQTLTDEGFTSGNHTEGHAVALWGDVLAVGAPNMDVVEFGGTIPHAGVVKIYTRDPQGWTLSQTLVSPAPAAQNNFGSAVALRDGFLVVGEPGNDLFGISNRGAAFGYFDTGDGSVDFTYQDRQVGTHAEQHAGSSIAIERYSNDAPYIVLSGAPGGQETTQESLYGGVYASAWEIAGTQISLLDSKFISPVLIGVPTPTWNERFGASVAIVPQKCVPEIACVNSYYAAIGYPGYGASRGGAMILAFHADADVSTWNFELQLPASDESQQAGEGFGTSVDLDPGNGLGVPPRLVVGSPFAVNAPPLAQVTGAVRVFERSLDSPDWIHGPQVYGPIAQSGASQFGKTVQIKGDRIWAGAPYYDVAGSSGTGEGAVFLLFRLANNTWSNANELHTNPPMNGAFLGSSFAYDSRRLVVGATGADGFNTWIDCGATDTFFCSSFEY